jgi:NAD(P)-dependent dehydrogenase (short-subunit alcohol dehydrogenase family)
VTRSRVALVTGAAGGIGRTVAETYLADGYDVLLADHSPDLLAPLADELRVSNPERSIWTVAMDVSSPDSVADAAQRAHDLVGQVDVLALIAGVVQQAAAVDSLSVEEWDRVHAVNLRGPFLVARAFLPLMPRHAGAAIVGIASWWGRSGHAYYAAYCTSKAGVISLVQCLAAELAPEGIRANAVSPGNIDTQMHRSALESEAAERGVSFEEMKAIEWAKIPLGIAGPPQSIADAVLFLSSEKSSYITGATLDVNGGVQFN